MLTTNSGHCKRDAFSCIRYCKTSRRTLTKLLLRKLGAGKLASCAPSQRLFHQSLPTRQEISSPGTAEQHRLCGDTRIGPIPSVKSTLPVQVPCPHTKWTGTPLPHLYTVYLHLNDSYSRLYFHRISLLRYLKISICLS